MLILARKNDHYITIGNDILVTITNIHPNQVHVGVDAPRHIPVHRGEIYNKLKKQTSDIA